MNRVAEDINKLLDIRMVRHILFWFLYLVSMAYIHSSGIHSGGFLSWLENYLVEFPVLAGLTYTVTYLVIPRLLLKRHYSLFIFSFLVCLLFFSFLNVLLDVSVIQPAFFPERQPVPALSVKSVIVNAFGLVFPLVIFITISFARYINLRESGETRAQQLKLMQQMEIIRNQMHPVFLKDALNDLYITAVDSPAKLPDMILKLSDILQYLIYECKSTRVSLMQEERAIRQYMGFEKIVYNGYRTELKINGNPENVSIPPYILFPLTRAVTVFQKGETDMKDRISVSITIGRKNLTFEAGKTISGQARNLDFAWKDEIALARKQLDSVKRWKYKLDVIETERKLQIVLNLDL